MKYRDPVVYESIKRQMDSIREEKTAQLQRFLGPAEEAFKKRGIEVQARRYERPV